MSVYRGGREIKYSYEDWLSWGEDFRAEIIDGDIYMMAQPIQRHQEIVGEIFRQIATYLRGKRCKVFPSPFGVRLEKRRHTVLEPDIVVVCDPSKLDGKVCNGAPDMVVEVLSPSTAQRDRLIKRKLYQKAGVLEYWLVDPDWRNVDVYILRDENYTIESYGAEDTVAIHCLDDCKINMQSVFDVDDRIVRHVEENIIPQYKSFDKAHNVEHVRRVISRSLESAQNYAVDLNRIYIIAAYHDIGMVKGRKDHEKHSAEILRNDEFLRGCFGEDELSLMYKAVEDHRASAGQEPRSIYGKIVSDADNDLDYISVLRRCIQHSIASYLEYGEDSELHFKGVKGHMLEKYGEGGYLQLWLNSESDVLGLQEIRDKLYADEQGMRFDFERLWLAEH